MLVRMLIGLPLLSLGALVTCLNVYTSFLRYPLHRLRGGTRADFRWVSGFPLIGSMLLCLAAMFLSPWPALLWTAAALFLVDTGGPHWLAGTLVYMHLFKRGEGTQHL